MIPLHVLWCLCDGPPACDLTLVSLSLRQNSHNELRLITSPSNVPSKEVGSQRSCDKEYSGLPLIHTPSTDFRAVKKPIFVLFITGS